MDQIVRRSNGLQEFTLLQATRWSVNYFKQWLILSANYLVGRCAHGFGYREMTVYVLGWLVYEISKLDCLNYTCRYLQLCNL